MSGVTLARITTDGPDAYPRALRTVFGEQGIHRTNRSLHNHREQEHRGSKQWYRPMGGFRQGPTAARFCRLFDEVRACLRPPSHRHPSLYFKQRRAHQQEWFARLMSLTAPA